MAEQFETAQMPGYTKLRRPVSFGVAVFAASMLLAGCTSCIGDKGPLHRDENCDFSRDNFPYDAIVTVEQDTCPDEFVDMAEQRHVEVLEAPGLSGGVCRDYLGYFEIDRVDSAYGECVLRIQAGIDIKQDVGPTDMGISTLTVACKKEEEEHYSLLCEDPVSVEYERSAER